MLRINRKVSEIGIAYFDFDDTLTAVTKERTGVISHSESDPNKDVLDELFRLATDGWEIRLISEREDTKHNNGVLEKFIEDFEIPVESVVFTNAAPKTEFLKNANLLYDDDPLEIHKAIEKYPALTAVLVPTLLNVD